MEHDPHIAAECDGGPAEAPPADPPPEAEPGPLDFVPVPLRIKRVDGWTPERQRAYIAALAAAGSPHQAAQAIGMSASGLPRLRTLEGAEGFVAAEARAMAMAAERQRGRISAGVAAVESEAWQPPAPPPPPEEDEAEEDRRKEEWFDAFLKKYLLKVGQERESRLAGRIVEADYYLRQLTHIEVMIDLASQGHGLDRLKDFRESGRHITDIAETPMSRILGQARRAQWAEIGDPPRPEHPPRRYLEHHGHFSTEPSEYCRGGSIESIQAQQRAFEERHARDAAAQVEWEAAARRDYERRRDSDAAS